MGYPREIHVGTLPDGSSQMMAVALTRCRCEGKPWYPFDRKGRGVCGCCHGAIVTEEERRKASGR